MPTAKTVLPPITGMPTERPVCAGCGKKLQPYVVTEYSPYDPHHPRHVVSRTFRGRTAYEGLFHTLNCALRFATLAHRAGYRLKEG